MDPCEECGEAPCECDDFLEEDDEEEVTWGADELGEEEDV